MIISTRKKFIFAAFNKTGTTSIEHVLQRYNNRFMYLYLFCQHARRRPDRRMFKHVRPYHLKQILGNAGWEKYFSFSFVRNPWSRAVSLYFAHRKSPRRPRLLDDLSFDDWVRSGGTGTAQRSMFEFITDDDGNVITSFTGKYEYLERDFRTICEHVALPTPGLPHLNRSSDGDYRKYYTSETRDIVAGWARVDIEKFGYDF
jgi:hypothetical protein